MKNLIPLTLILLFNHCLSYSQASINPAGNSSNINGFTIEYALGEVATMTFSNGDVLLTQGLLQPTYQLVTGIKREKDLVITCFPNPTFGEVFVKDEDGKVTHIEIIDARGQIRVNSLLTNPINIVHLNAGIYLIRMFGADNQTITSLKIIKQ